MRLALAALVFTASIVAAALVLTAPAKAAWSAPVDIGAGEAPRVRIDANHHYVALVRGRRIEVRQNGVPHATVTLPAAGRLAGYDLDQNGGVVALRLDRHNKRLLALIEGSWRRISPSGGTPVDPRLAVDPSGAAAAVWLQYEGERVYVYAATRGPNARRFLPPQKISGSVLRGGQPLSVGVDAAGDAVAAFVEKRDLYLYRLGRKPVKIHDATGVVAGAFATSAAVAGNTAVVVFTRLEDLEPPRYRASLAVQPGEAPPVISTVAEDVSAIDVFADRFDNVYTAPIGPPFRIDAFPSGRSWTPGQAPSSIRAEGAVVAWTEGVEGFAAAGDQKLSLGRAYEPDVAEAPQRAIVAWDAGPRRPARYATFTP